MTGAGRGRRGRHTLAVVGLRLSCSFRSSDWYIDCTCARTMTCREAAAHRVWRFTLCLFSAMLLACGGTTEAILPDAGAVADAAAREATAPLVFEEAGDAA